MGTAISPLADDDQIIVHPGYDLLTAFDAQTGDIVWQSGDPGVWALPTMAELDGVRQVVSVACQVVEGVAPVDGAVLWKYPINPQMVHAVTPLVHDGMVLVTGQDSGVKALRPRRRGDEWEVDLVWETRDVAMTLSAPVLIDDALVGLSGRSSGPRKDSELHRGRQRHLGAAGDLRESRVHQGHRHADPLDARLTWDAARRCYAVPRSTVLDTSCKARVTAMRAASTPGFPKRRAILA